MSLPFLDGRRYSIWVTPIVGSEVLCFENVQLYRDGSTFMFESNGFNYVFNSAACACIRYRLTQI